MLTFPAYIEGENGRTAACLEKNIFPEEGPVTKWSESSVAISAFYRDLQLYDSFAGEKPVVEEGLAV